MTFYSDEDPLVTALDGRAIDVSVDLQAETVVIVIPGASAVHVTAAGARQYAQQLLSAAAVVDGSEGHNVFGDNDGHP